MCKKFVLLCLVIRVNRVVDPVAWSRFRWSRRLVVFHSIYVLPSLFLTCGISFWMKMGLDPCLCSSNYIKEQSSRPLVVVGINERNGSNKFKRRNKFKRLARSSGVCSWAVCNTILQLVAYKVELRVCLARLWLWLKQLQLWLFWWSEFSDKVKPF